MGLSGRVPHRVDAATKAGLLDLIDQAVEGGWTIRRACGVLELGEVRTHRWYARRARGKLADKAPGGSPMHGILPEEAEEILALFDQWGEVDRSHRKLAHRGSYLGRVWVSPSTVRRVLFLADKHFRPLPRPGKSKRRPFPDWVEYTPNSIWIYDTTHFTKAGMAVLIIHALKRCQAKAYRDHLATACFEYAATAGDVSLVLYDVTTLYFEAEHEDELRKVGFSKERRVDPQIRCCGAGPAGPARSAPARRRVPRSARPPAPAPAERTHRRRWW